MAEIKKYLDTAALGTLVDQIKAEDAKGLKAAKDYADGLAKNYDAAGAAGTAEANAKAYTDELANGQVKTNKEAIAKLNGAATEEGSVAKAVADAKALIDADIDAVEAIAGKNKEDIAAINNAESGILAQAKAYADAEDAKIEEAVGKVEEYVGTFTHETAKTVVEYINAKTDGIATSGNLEALGQRVTTVEGKVATIEGDYLKAADKTELEGKITTAQLAAETAQGAVDTLSGTHATDKKALEDAIALKADQTALDAVSAVANAAVKQSDYNTKVKALEDEDARIVGLVEAEAERAAGVEESLQTQINTIMNNPDAEGAINSINEFTQYVADHGTIAEGFRTDINALKEVVPTLETKEDATAKFDEIKGYVDAKAVQADWNQNDANAADFIKNRPFYHAEEALALVGEFINIETKLPEHATETDKYVPNYFTESVITDLQDTYDPKDLVVEFDGVRYDVEGFAEFWGYYIGDLAMGNCAVTGNSTDVDKYNNFPPFTIVLKNKYSTGTYFATKEAGVHTFRIYTKSGGLVQLDEKFIPDTIARVSDVTELDERITAAVATKVEQSAYDEKVAALESADTGLGNRITALENRFAGEGSVEDLIAAAKQEAIDVAATDASNKDAVVLSEAQKYADAEDAKIEARVDALEAESAKHALAADLTALAGRVTTAEGEIDTLQSEMDAVEAKALANEGEISTIKTDLAKKAAQADLEAAVARVAANEGAITTINETLADKAEADDLDAAVVRIAANETAIAANTSAINSFTAITPDEINALFA